MALSAASQTEPADDADRFVFSASAVVHHDPWCADVTVTGELCAGTAPDLRGLLDGLITDGITAITLDVSSLRICTSHGVDAIAESRDRLADVGGWLSIAHADGAVRKVFEIVGMPLHPEHP